MKPSTWLALLVIGFLLLSCVTEVGGGSSTETGNGLSMVIKDAKGNPVPNASARIHRSDFNPILGKSDSLHIIPAIPQSNSRGELQFDISDSGRFVLELIDSNGTGILLTEFEKESGLLKSKSARFLGSFTVTMVQSVRGQVTRQSGSSLSGLWVYFRGTEHFAILDTSGHYDLGIVDARQAYFSVYGETWLRPSASNSSMLDTNEIQVPDSNPQPVTKTDQEGKPCAIYSSDSNYDSLIPAISDSSEIKKIQIEQQENGDFNLEILDLNSKALCTSQ